MDRILNVIRKLLLTVNWIVLGITSFSIVAFYFREVGKVESVNSTVEKDSFWFSILKPFTNNEPTPTFYIFLIGVVVLVLAIILHILINWIFADDGKKVVDK